MKIVGIFLGIVLCLVGVFAGLLFTHKIPAAKLAKASPAVAGALTKLGLYHSPKNMKLASSAASTDTAPSSSAAPAISKDDADEKQSLDAERQQIAAERDALNKARSAPASAAPPAALAPKLADIYDTMSPDDLARIFAKQGDSQVVSALSAMDEKKAGKVMAALPADRAAKLALMLNSQPQQPANAGAAA